MNEWQYKRLVLGLGLTLIVLVLYSVSPGLFETMEHGTLAAEYRIRGEEKIDSSIVVLYLNNNDIEALGGFPLKRSYYALVLNVLHELGAKAVGIDITFAEPDQEHPEYDQVLASEIHSSGNVVLSGYFRTISAHEARSENLLPERFTYVIGNVINVIKGTELDVPFAELLDSATSFGHTNLMDNLDVPVVIQEGRQYVPAFCLEVLRQSMNIGRSQVLLDERGVSMTSGDRRVSIPFSDQGTAEINFAGGINSLNVFSVVHFLKAYDAFNAGELPALPVNLKDKIVLLGIIAEGRSAFVATPFEQQFPSIGIHANMLDNALKNNFLKRNTPLAMYVLTAFVGLLCTALLTMRKERTFILLNSVLLLALVFTSYILFWKLALVIPIATPITADIVVTAGILLYQHRVVRVRLHTVSEEKESIIEQLKQKELKLRALENDLLDSQQRNMEQHTKALRDEINKYKHEIVKLKTQGSDLEPFQRADEHKQKGRDEFNGIIYDRGGQMGAVVEFIKKISDSDATALLLGESGTGKELVARALHQHSRRNKNAFVAVNCGALTETLLESELFGHEKGAFTGAVKEKPGRFELAEGGTIFLDEIAETSEAFQVKLLRVLQESTFERVGGTETKKANVRVIAATNRDIKLAVAEKKFREDLYYRLNIFTIQIPPLRERVVDIPILAEYFLSFEQSGMGISASVMKGLQEYSWKGNVRELQSVIKRAALLAKSEDRNMIRTKDLPEEIAVAATSATDIEDRIMESLRDKNFSRNAISETADDLGGLNRGTVAEYLRGYCFRIFVESGSSISSAVTTIAGTDDEITVARVRKKLQEYLQNAVEHVDKLKPILQVQDESKPKYKNLPQRYHAALEKVINSYYNGEWNMDAGIHGNYDENA